MPTDFNHLTDEEQRDFEFLRERRLAQLAALLIEERGLSFSDAFRELYMRNSTIRVAVCIFNQHAIFIHFWRMN